jgi:NAD(P)-dependent dehydrogenase (short-subunit alcohol dehydrogenase family)
MPVALITGASAGLGRELARALAARGWTLVIDARTPGPLDDAAAELGARTWVEAVPGDVTDPDHRATLAAAVSSLGGLDLLVNNASELGPSPMPSLATYPLDALARVYEVDVLAPVALTQLLLPALTRADGAVVNVSSDAAVEAYPGWGGYGGAKAALDHTSAVLAAEHPDLRVYAADPGDMRTDMHQRAFPGEDISDRPWPAAAVPGLLRLIDTRPPSGRYRAADLLSGSAQGTARSGNTGTDTARAADGSGDAAHDAGTGGGPGGDAGLVGHGDRGEDVGGERQRGAGAAGWVDGSTGGRGAVVNR